LARKSWTWRRRQTHFTGERLDPRPRAHRNNHEARHPLSLSKPAVFAAHVAFGTVIGDMAVEPSRPWSLPPPSLCGTLISLPLSPISTARATIRILRPRLSGSSFGCECGPQSRILSQRPPTRVWRHSNVYDPSWGDPRKGGGRRWARQPAVEQHARQAAHGLKKQQFGPR
jgi:hypothetical protein